jgi:two-component sensor histidine kinase
LVAFSVDARDHIWAALAPYGIVVLDVQTGRILSRYPTTASRPFNHIIAMYHDGEDRIWLGTRDNGIYIIDTKNGEVVRRFTRADGLPGDQIRSIFRDSDGQMWIGTRYDGLVLKTGDGFRTLSMRDGLASNAIWSIDEDSQKRLWLLTDAGLVSVDRLSFKPLPLKPELVGEAVTRFGIHRNKFLWCKTFSSLTIMDFAKESHNLNPPLVHIVTFEAGGRSLNPEDNMELAYNQNTLSFEYIGINLRNEKAVQYRYRMLGLDTAWSQSSNQRRVTFAALSPGSYTFQVEAINGDGVASIQPASALFTIMPPFWQRWWFIGLALITVMAILWTLYRYRVGKILEMEHLRVRIASDLHDDVGTNLSSIQVVSQIMERQGSLSDQDRAQLREIGSIATSTQEMMRDIVWMLNPKNDTLDDFLLRMKEVAARLLPDIRHTFIVPHGKLLDKVSIEFKRNVFLIFKEALNNIVRHARATEAVIRVEQANGVFRLEIRDDGNGFDVAKARRGNGLANLRRRAGQVGGTIDVSSKPGGGTVVTLTVKNHANA